MENTICLVTNESGDWEVLLLNGEVYHEGHSIPTFIWLNLITELGYVVNTRELTDTCGFVEKGEIAIENREISEIPRKPNGVVRCKKCRYLRPRNGYEDRYVCTRWNNTTGLNEFCSYGAKVRPFIVE